MSIGSNRGSNGHRGGSSSNVDVGLSGNLDIDVGLSSNLLMDIGLSSDILPNVGLSRDLDIDVGLSGDFLMDVFLSGNLDIDVGLGSRVQVSIGDTGVIDSSIDSGIRGSHRVVGVGNSWSSISYRSSSSVTVTVSSRRIGIARNQGMSCRGNDSWLSRDR